MRRDAQLKAHIVDAVNLPSGDAHKVILEQGGHQAETDNAAVGKDPIWNEAIIFKITEPKKPFTVIIRNQDEEEVLRASLSLENYKNYSEMNKDVWVQDEKSDAAIRLRLLYSWSDVQKFEQLLVEWDREIQQDKEFIEAKQYQLEIFDEPFGLLSQQLANGGMNT